MHAADAALPTPLPGGYHLRVIDDDTFDALFRIHRSQAFAGTFDLDLADAINAQEQQALQPLRQRLDSLWRLNVGLFRGDELVGWSWGRQSDGESFTMVNSAVLPAYRGQGLYQSLLRALLPQLQAQGFQVVRSRHVATNNAVLVAKMKAGFVITGFELSDRFGALVLLSHFFNPLRRQVLDVRAGLSRPDDAVRRALRIG